MWNPQIMNDYEMLTRTYRDEKIIFGLMHPQDILPDTDRETCRRAAEKWVEKYSDYRVALNCLGVPYDFAMAVYEYSRIAYQSAD